jgi:hypothetical protein
MGEVSSKGLACLYTVAHHSKKERKKEIEKKEEYLREEKRLPSCAKDWQQRGH